MKRTYSTVEVAKMLGIAQPQLQRSISKRRITAPPLIQVGRVKVRLWSTADIRRARKQLKETYYKKTPKPVRGARKAGKHGRRKKRGS